MILFVCRNNILQHFPLTPALVFNGTLFWFFKLTKEEPNYPKGQETESAMPKPTRRFKGEWAGLHVLSGEAIL